jgi:type I restriction enzyme S subunit
MSARANEAGNRRLRRYPAYKDSGIEWLGDVPDHWRVTRTKYAAQLRSGHTPSRLHPEYWEKCTIPWFGLADVWQIRDGQLDYVTETAEKISEIGLANSAARVLPKGTVMLSRTASVGFSTIMGVDMATTQDFVNWVCRPGLRPEYLLYVFRSMQSEFRRLTMGSTHQTIYMPDAARFATAVPPLSEQDAIVRFVRARTGRINVLIAKQHQLVELLRERRTALVESRVLAGLVGRTRWPSVRLSHALRERQTSVRVKPDEMYREIGIRSHGRGIFHKEAVSGSMLDEKAVYSIEPGDLVFNVVFAWEGAVAIASHAESGFVASHRFPTYVPRGNATNVTYLRWFFGTRYGLALLDQHSPGSAGRNRTLDRRELLKEQLPMPPRHEQDEIVQLIERDTTKIDALTEKARQAIDHLKELRVSLISAAVTGKIDVREEVA